MAHGQTLPPVAEAYHRRQQLEILAASQAASRAWGTLSRGPVTEASWGRVKPRLMAVLVTGQTRVAGRAPGYVSSLLRSTGQSAADDPFASAVATPLLGFAGDGRELSTLLDLAPGRTRVLVRSGVSDAAARQATDDWLRTVVETAVADTARQAETLEIALREQIQGYIRMVNAGACSRCAVQAGRWFRRNTGFERHPRCRCIHVPASEANVAGDWRLSPDDYFASLDEAEQNRIFTHAGAEAIRNGADVTQVVNVRRGMSTAQINQRGWTARGRLVRADVFGEQVYVTTEGTTRRGRASRRATGRRTTVRLMPESILEIAGDDRQELTRLLRVHGYIA